MATATTLHTLLIVDRSGSMESCREATITTFNEHVQTLRELEREEPRERHTITLGLFNHRLVTPLFMAPPAELRELTTREYVPNGNTALLDAVGSICARLEAHVGKEERVAVTILTDGYENSSREYTSAAIAAMIARLEKTGLWTFSFIGAGEGVAAQAGAINIKVSNTITVSAGPAGMAQAAERLHTSKRRFVERMRRGDDVSEGFFEEK